MAIAFRPHHFLCALCFEGRGYSPSFIANFSAIMAILNSPTGDNTPIQIVNATDSICAPCPNRQNTLCTTEDKIQILDKAHANALMLTPGSHLTWGEAKASIRDNLTLETFHQICATCEWKALGICENVLNKFL